MKIVDMAMKAAENSDKGKNHGILNKLLLLQTCIELHSCYFEVKN